PHDAVARQPLAEKRGFGGFMVGTSRRAHARLVVSFGALMIAAIHSSASAQTPAQGQQLPPVRVDAPPKKRTAAKPKPAPRPQPVARRRIAPPVVPAPQPASREPTTDVVTKTQEPVINTLAAGQRSAPGADHPGATEP